MKVVIFAGGTGSIALQRGLYHTLESDFDGVDTKIIVNAYDNGLSTGAVRKVMDGKILGPSDVRKNHATRLALTDPDSPWLNFLNCRFTADSYSVRDLLQKKTIRLFEDLEMRGPHVDGRGTLFGAIDEYFKAPLAATIEYRDFSLSNIIYAGIARASGNSLRTAARIMAGIMSIADSVLLNDDESLYLGAIAQSGKRVCDEGLIVSWGDETDPFIDVFFTDANGNESKPSLCLEAWRAILEADLLILSPGTQWSSLIPSYASDGFREAIDASKAKVVMIMNRTPDMDSPSQTASAIIDVLVPRYFGSGRLHVISDKNAHPQFRYMTESSLAKVASFDVEDLSTAQDPPGKHDSIKLSRAVSYIFFRDYLDSDYYVFDYDDTLVDRNGTLPRSSRFNIKGLSRLNWLTNIAICTGNTIRALNLHGESSTLCKTAESNHKPLLVFADGGVNLYSYDIGSATNDSDNQYTLVDYICHADQLLTVGPFSAVAIVEALRRVGIVRSTIDVRGNFIIAIKPVTKENRKTVVQIARHIVRGSDLEVRERGQTTVEICRPTVSKRHVVTHLCTSSGGNVAITYVGDELESGNDSDVESVASQYTKVRCLHVRDPAKTAFFIRTLIAQLENNVMH